MSWHEHITRYLSAFLYQVGEWWLRLMLRHRAPEGPDRPDDGDHEPRHSRPDEDFGVDDTDRTLEFLRLMREPGQLAEPEPGSDEAWTREFDALEAWSARTVEDFRAALYAKVDEIGETVSWASLIRTAERRIVQWRREAAATQAAERQHRIEASLTDTAEIPVVRELVDA